MPSESVINDTASNLATSASYDNKIAQFKQNVKSDISNNNIREDNDVIPLKKDVDKSTNIPLTKSNDTLKIRAEKITKSINGEKPIEF